MGRSLTAEETKAQYVSVMGSELGPVFYALYNELVWLHLRWRQYVTLFGTKPTRIELLNRAAGLFFRVVQDSLFEDTLLHLSRMTDKAVIRGRPNLTVQRLPALVTDQDLAAEVRSLVDDAVEKAGFARDWRNRHIAHSDLALAIQEGAKPLAAASRRAVNEAIKALDVVLNRLEEHFLYNTILFEGFSQPGDGECLLYVVRDGLEVEESRQKRLQQGQPAEGGFDSRPV